MIFNALAKEFTNDEQPIKNFLALMRNQGDNKSRFITKIQDEIIKIKQEPERRRGFMKFELDLMDARREGREEGKREGREEGKREGKKEGKAEMASAIARNLIAMRMSKEAVAKATGLSIDEVQALMAS